MDNADQKAFWTNAAGPKWLAHQAALDHNMQPVLDGVLTRADLKKGQVVLDIGCGTGASALRAAEAVGPMGHVFGVDISGPMLARAQERAVDQANLSFAHADAADHAFDEESFDHLVSRFGVMFFADPVAAFANMAKALRRGGKVTFAAWGQIPENPFFTLAAQAARQTIGAPPKSDPDLPGPFAFRNTERVLDILDRAGLANASCEAAKVDLTPAGSLHDFAELLASIGPADAAVTHFNATQDQRAQLRGALIDHYSVFQTDKGLRIPAEINFFTATKT